MMFQRVAFLTGAAALALAAIPATAATIVDTGPGDPNTPFNYSLLPSQALAAKFTTGATTIGTIQGSINGAAGTFTIALYSVTTTGFGTVPGTELFSTAASSDGTDGWHGVSGLNWSVGAGDYFVAFEVRGGDSFTGGMYSGAPNALANEAFTNGNVWYQYDDLNVGVRIADQGGLSGAVPEPANWALMIAGFGLAGGAMRVRRRKVAYA